MRSNSGTESELFTLNVVQNTVVHLTREHVAILLAHRLEIFLREFDHRIRDGS